MKNVKFKMSLARLVVFFHFSFFISPSPSFGARLFTCGFEENDFTATIWSATNSSPAIQTATVRSGAYAMRAQTGATTASVVAQRNLSAADTAGTYWVRFLFRVADLPDSLPYSIFIWGNTNSSAVGSGPIHVRLVSGPRLSIQNVLTSTQTDGSTTLNLNQWYRVELKVVLGDSPNGSVELKLDGTVEASQSATDTLDGANGFNKFFVGFTSGGLVSATNNYDAFFDDLAVNDETGAFQNDYPGDGRVALLNPVSDVSVQFTRAGSSPSASNFGGADDVPGAPNDGVDYNEDLNTTNVDRLGLSNLPAEVAADADMVLMDLYGRVGSDGTSSRTMIFRIWDEAGAATDGPSVNAAVNGWKLPAIGATNEHQVFDLGARTKANVDGFDAGYKGASGANRAKRTTALWANVEWKDAAAPPPGPATLPRVVRW